MRKISLIFIMLVFACFAFSQVSENISGNLKFDLLYKASKYNYEKWSGNVWGTLGFLVIVLGWLLTSATSRLFLSKNDSVRKVAIWVVAIIAVINMLLNLNLAHNSATLQKYIENDEYVQAQGLESKHYDSYEVKYCYAIFSDVLIGIIFLFVLFFLLSLSKWKEPSNKSES